MKSFFYRSVLALIACVLAACGQRGPLYLPKDPAPVSGPMTPAPLDRPVAPATETRPAEPVSPASR